MYSRTIICPKQFIQYYTLYPFPCTVQRNYLEDRFSHTIVVQNVYLFNQESNGLEVLSVDLEGLYVRNLDKKGVVINAEDGRTYRVCEKNR